MTKIADHTTAPHDALAATGVPKKLYNKPVLVEYGDVREFTKGPGGSQKDSKAGGFKSS